MADMSKELAELRARRSLAAFVIKILESVPDSDPRKFDALNEYHRQWGVIQSKITALDPTDFPPDIVVSIKSATLSGFIPK